MVVLNDKDVRQKTAAAASNNPAQRKTTSLFRGFLAGVSGVCVERGMAEAPAFPCAP